MKLTARRVGGGALVLLSILSVPLGVMGYRILTIDGTASVLEAIELDKSSFSVSMYPGETHVETITATNHSSASLDLNVSLAGSNALDTSISPNQIVAPGNGTVQFQVHIEVPDNAAPGSYDIDVRVDR